MNGFKIGKDVHCHPDYLTSMQIISWECEAGWITSWNQDCWEKDQQPQICRWNHSNGRKWRGIKEPLNEGESFKPPSTFKKTKITLWQVEVDKVEAVTDFIFLGSKITVDSECSHEIKRHLLLGRKAITNQDNVLKSRDITLPTKVHIVKAVVFKSCTNVRAGS